MQGHNHNCDTLTALIHQKVSNMLKLKAADCLSDKPSKIIHRALMEDGTLNISESDLERFYKNMYEVTCTKCLSDKNSIFQRSDSGLNSGMHIN